MTLLEKIDIALELCRTEQQRVGSYIDLPVIINSLEKIKKIISMDERYEKAQRIKTAAALGRIVMEDYKFSKSELGLMLIRIADEFEDCK
ncbi:MAG: hypothetical protein K6U80_03390 [Firmicutes bacterium]|nr:hypothetical protein [Bacillota bacterium]